MKTKLFLVLLIVGTLIIANFALSRLSQLSRRAAIEAYNTESGIIFKGNSTIRKTFSLENISFYTITGEVKNTGDSSYESFEVEVIADLYNNGNLVETNSAYLTSDISPNETSSFQVMLANPPDFDSYKLKIQVD